MAKLKLMKEKAAFKPLQVGAEVRIQKRRASQAKHRHNLAACFKNLHGVLPEEDITKVHTSTQTQPGILQDAFSGIKTNRTMLLNRAKDYVSHLESVVSMLIAESHEQSLLTPNLGDCQEPTPSTSKNNHLSCIKDVQRNFLSNFQLSKPFSEYSFENVEESDEEEVEETIVEKFTNKVIVQPNQGPMTQPTLNSNAVSSEANPLLLIPINVRPMFGSASMYVNSTAPPLPTGTSPTNISVDLGFVSAENASQEGHEMSSPLI